MRTEIGTAVRAEAGAASARRGDRAATLRIEAVCFLGHRGTSGHSPHRPRSHDGRDAALVGVNRARSTVIEAEPHAHNPAPTRPAARRRQSRCARRPSTPSGGHNPRVGQCRSNPASGRRRATNRTSAGGSVVPEASGPSVRPRRGRARAADSTGSLGDGEASHTQRVASSGGRRARRPTARRRQPRRLAAPPRRCVAARFSSRNPRAGRCRGAAR
jgi:hypothetical protein